MATVRRIVLLIKPSKKELSTMTSTPVQCGECGGLLVRMGDNLHGDYAKCEDCGHEVSVDLDIRPNLEEGESLVWVTDPADWTRNVLNVES